MPHHAIEIPEPVAARNGSLFDKQGETFAAAKTLFSMVTNMMYAYQWGKWIIDLFCALLQVDPIYPIQH